MADIKWLGHACVRVKTRDTTVIMDPAGREAGVNLAKQRADIVTLSRRGTDPAILAPIEGEYTLVDGPGEYEVRDIFVRGIRTGGKAGDGGSTGSGNDAKAFNTVYLVEMDEVLFCHLGALTGTLTPAQAEVIGDPDVLFVPIGEPGGLPTAKATEVIGQLTPKMVIPVLYRTGDDAGERALREFIAALGFTDVSRGTSVVLRKGNLPDTMGIQVLDV